MFGENIFTKKAINYDFLVNYLKISIQKEVYLDTKEIKKILTALGVKFEEEEKKSHE